MGVDHDGEGLAIGLLAQVPAGRPGGPCCTDQRAGRSEPPRPRLRSGDTDRWLGVQSPSILFSADGGEVATSVASVLSVRDRNASSVTRLNRPIAGLDLCANIYL